MPANVDPYEPRPTNRQVVDAAIAGLRADLRELTNPAASTSTAPELPRKPSGGRR
jgi:hypothetical protein